MLCSRQTEMKPVNGSERFLLFASVPKKDELCSVTVRASFGSEDEKFGPCYRSAYHCQILKCRQLIFYVPDIIATPVLGSYSNIHIITTVQNYESAKLLQHLQKFKLTPIHNGYYPVTNSAYEACLRYTLIAVLAPSWNQVGECLIQGRDFLTRTTPMNAVKLDVAVSDDEVVLVLWPARAMLPLLKLEDLDVGGPSQNGIHLESQRVHVLPSQKKGRVVSISRDLPQGCFFSSYKHMRQHWKNLYGYRLPESDEQMIYYSVYFQPLGPTLYTYPSICVRPMALSFLKRADHLDILQNFLADVRQKIPTICGKPFGVDYRVGCAVPKLLKCNGDMEPALPMKEISTSIEPQFIKPTLLHDQELKTMANDDGSKKEDPPQPLQKLSPEVSTSQLSDGETPKPVNGNEYTAPFKFISHKMERSPVTGKLDVTTAAAQSSCKKPRPRPQVRTDVDVEAMARRRDLIKVNTATLVNWLRRQMVPCKVKDRKSDLVDKVMRHLNLE